jgi:N-acetylmuramoyl-L-alanine amidase
VQVNVSTTGPAILRHGYAAGGGNRFFVDVRGAYATSFTSVPYPPAKSVISRVRVAQYSTYPPVTRIVLDVKPGFRARQATPVGRPVAVLTRPGSGPLTSAPHAHPRPETASAPPPQREPDPLPSRSGRGKVIALDAGHGGRDPGASGRSGLREKTVALDVVRRVTERLRRSGHRVVVSRSSDKTLPPSRRSAWIGRTRSDVLVSIHCDATPVRSAASGATTYFHGFHGPSRTLARSVQRSMVHKAGVRDGGVRSDLTRYSHGFYLLRKAKRPAVLVEVGYISNPKTERMLASAAYRQKLADGIAGGILSYLN